MSLDDFNIWIFKTLKDLLKKAQAGKPVDESDIPPPIAATVARRADPPRPSDPSPLPVFTPTIEPTITPDEPKPPPAPVPAPRKAAPAPPQPTQQASGSQEPSSGMAQFQRKWILYELFEFIICLCVCFIKVFAFKYLLFCIIIQYNNL